MAQGQTYTVASTLEDILTRRKAEERQARLDALHEEQVRASLAIQKENAESNRMYRDAWADERRQNAASKFKAGLSMGQPLDPNDPTYGGMLSSADIVPGVHPERDAVVGPQGLEGGPKIFGMTPDVTGKDAADFIEGNTTKGVKSIAPIVKPPTFYGTPKEVEENKKRDSMRAYAKSLPADSPLRAAIEYNLASGGDNPPAAAITPPKPTTETGVVLGRDGKYRINGQVVDATKLPAGAHISTEPAPPRPPATKRPDFFTKPDPKDPSKTIGYYVDPDTLQVRQVPLDDARRGNPPAAKTDKIEAVVPSNLVTALKQADAEVAKYTGSLSSKEGKAKATSQRQAIVDQIFALHPRVASAVRSMAKNPAAAGFTFDDLVKGLNPQPSEADKEVMRVLYGVLTGKQ